MTTALGVPAGGAAGTAFNGACADDATPPAAGGARILIIDPLPAQRDPLTALLRRAGYHPVHSPVHPSGSEHPAPPPPPGSAGPETPFDLVLLHLHLPGLQGFDALAPFMNDLPGERSPPVLAITHGPGEPWQALQAGARDCLRAPFEARELLTRMHHLLEAHQAHRQLVQRLHRVESQLQQRGQAWPAHAPGAALEFHSLGALRNVRMPRLLQGLSALSGPSILPGGHMALLPHVPLWSPRAPAPLASA